MSTPKSKKQVKAFAAGVAWEAKSGMPQQRKPRRRNRNRRPKGQAKSSGNNFPNVIVPGNAGKRRGRRQRQSSGLKTTTLSGVNKPFIVPINELVGIEAGSVNFTTGILPLNPGHPLTFPFLSKVAILYERYEFMELAFHFIPSVSSFATQGQQGFVGISVTPDAQQAPPTSQSQAEIMTHSPIVETANKTNLQIPKSLLEPVNRDKRLVRGLLMPGGGDPQTYDSGQVFNWTAGQVNGNQIGEIRVTGRVMLVNPILEPSAAFKPNFKVAVFQTVNAPVALTGVGFQVSWAAVPVVNGAGVVLSPSLTTFTLPKGNYLVDWTVDVDENVNNQQLIATSSLEVDGVQTSPFITQSSATMLAGVSHVALSGTWYVQSLGTTTVDLFMIATYPGGVPTIDGMLRFVAI